MALFSEAAREQAERLSTLAYSNPFRPARIEHERALLGDAFTPLAQVWNHRTDIVVENPNVLAVGELAEQLIANVRERLENGERPAGAAELALYDRTISYVLFHRFRDELKDQALGNGSGTPPLAAFYADFQKAVHDFVGRFELRCELTERPEHVFALLFQIRRAFHHIYTSIIGGSLASANLRARVWESIFTHDMARYRRCLYACMGDVPTLVTGPTGTGKELVARALGLSRYIPFDPHQRRFAANHLDCLRALNLSALSPTLIESELFGHRRGAFTGALADKTGWLESCGPHDTVFLDEIGDLDAALQVKLLRVLQTRVFQRLGDTENCRFRGKIVAATNRDLAALMAGGAFRTDFYYRLCADQIRTASLAAQLDHSAEELRHFVLYLAHRLVGEAEAKPLTDEVIAWIDANLGPEYPWPGNVRELEQCLRNIMIHNDYCPEPVAGSDSLSQALRETALTADELMRWYCTLVYQQTGSYQETARRLQLDRRTIKAKIDEELLAEYPLNDGS